MEILTLLVRAKLPRDISISGRWLVSADDAEGVHCIVSMLDDRGLSLLRWLIEAGKSG